jgi:hypothetical protein
MTTLIRYSSSNQRTSYTVPDSVTSFDELAFFGCASLTSITIPDSVTSINGGTFAVCTGLTDIIIPKSVTSIGDEAFWWCTGLTSITIPNSVTSIGEGAFVYCINLSDVYYSGTEKEWNNIVIDTDNDYLLNANIHYNSIGNNGEITKDPTSNDTKFTVVFIDNYGNVIYTQDVTSGADITVPAVPTIAGYTAVGWSLTNDEITALTESATITAVYEVQETGFKVVANGATITTADASAEDALDDVLFDTYTTVTATGATGWKIGDTVVGFGESYSFYVGSDITLTAVFEDVVDAPSSVAAISVSPIGATGAVKASFLATRTIADTDTYVTSGYLYTVSADATLDLANIDGKTVLASYCSTNSEQFILNVGRASQTGTISARAFNVYVDGSGVTQVAYADVQTFTY